MKRALAVALALLLSAPAMAQDAPRVEAVVVDGGVFLPDELAVNVAKHLVSCDKENEALKKSVTPPALVFVALAGTLLIGLGGGIALGMALPKR